MGSPNPSTAVARPDLRDAVLFEWDADGQRQKYIAPQFAPYVRVDERAANYKEVPREEFTKDVDTLRAPDGTFPRSDFRYGERSYSCEHRGHEVPIDAEESAVASRYFDSQMVATDIGLLKVHRDHEIRVISKMTANASGEAFESYTAAGTDWSTPATGTPITDLKDKVLSVEQASGVRPNVLALNPIDFKNMVETDQVLERVKYSGIDDPKNVTPAMIAAAIEIDRVLVASALKDTAKKGKAMTGDYIWPDAEAGLYYVARTPSIRRLSTAYTFYWPFMGADERFMVEQYWSDEKMSWIMRARRHSDISVRNPECGYILTGLRG